ncbi:hypothetical protein LZ635_18355, partial [Hafnia paralvei]|nr:hypothetical protein [Hafnia paralvei]
KRSRYTGLAYRGAVIEHIHVFHALGSALKRCSTLLPATLLAANAATTTSGSLPLKSGLTNTY